MEIRTIDRPHTAEYKGETVRVLSTRCPNRYEHGARCDIQPSGRRPIKDVPISDLKFIDYQEPEYDTTYVQTSSGAAMPVHHLRIIK